MMAVSGKSDLVDVELAFRMETETSYAVWNDEKDGRGREKWVWLSKKLVERDGSTFTMPEWLAIQKGLV